MIRARLGLHRGAFDLDCELEILAGVTVLFGPSGAGKSTVLRCLAGLERPDEGRIEVEGEVWLDSRRGRNLPSHRRRVGMVFQESALFPHLSVAENLAYGWRRAGNPGGREELERVLRDLGLGGLRSRRPASLSGGEKQRVALGRALLRGPRLLLLDEPLAALDETARSALLGFLEEWLRATGLPVLYVTHSLSETLRLADRILRMDDGRISESGNVETMAPLLGAGDRAGIVLEARDARETGELRELETAAGTLRVPVADRDLPSRSRRVRILARDVSLTLGPPRETSILNVLPARVAGIRRPDGEPPLVELRVGEALLLARITAHSLRELRIEEGVELWVQVKAVAVVG